ncbi:hypothetical protein DL546_006747 [Coniochaeta pulveracea]|nr:hypothetical protein DL546_006747 [Coniochaeta pulveracea]
MHSSYKRLVNVNPKARLSVGHFLEQGRRSGAFFDTPLIKLTEGVDNLGVKSEAEREEFLDDLENLTDDFPEDFFKMKVLPELLKSVEFGGGGPKAFGVVMKISTKLSNDDFESKVTPVVIRLFGNPDRAIRVCLLDSLPLMIDRLPQKVVNDKIFPQIVTGFTDIAPVVREQTLKSVLTLITKLSDRTINGDLLKYLAKTANDEQPGIRTNTTICLGKIAKHLGTSTRSKVLIAAFSRSLRDPFVHARNAALLALAVTGDYFSEEDCAARILPAICPCLIDKEKLVRDQAIKTMDVYVAKIKKAAATMPDTVLPPATTTEQSGPRMSTPQPESPASGGWAGWAISSFTNKLSAAAGEIEANGTSTPTPQTRPQPEAKRSAPGPVTSSASALHRQALKSPPPSAPLSRTSSSAGHFGDSFFADSEPSTTDDLDAWGDMDEGEENTDFQDAADDFAAATTRRSVSSSTSTVPKPASRSVSSSATPFDDAEPDFAGWLAAQQKKPGASKGLPKGLSKPGGGVAAKKPIAKSVAGSKPVAAKKIDLKPKETSNDDDGWGDGW